MPLTPDEIDTLVDTIRKNTNRVIAAMTRINGIVEVIKRDELPAGVSAEDVGRPGPAEGPPP